MPLRLTTSAKRRVAVLTGTRAEYGLLKSLLEAVRDHRALELQLVVTGMHLLPSCGRSVRDIEADGWKIDRTIPIYTGRDRRDDLGRALGTLVTNLSEFLVRRRTHLLVVLGDRVEVFGAAAAALAAGVPIAHLHGGEIAPGEMDDRIRYAVTSLANLHFVATAQSRRRLIRLGQPPRAVFHVGAIGLDHLLTLRRRLDAAGPGTVVRRFGLNATKPLLIVLQHPCGLGAEGEYQVMRRILTAVQTGQGLVIGPNTDPGHSGIIRAIREFFAQPCHRRRWRYLPHLPRPSFLEALWAADALVGNSSSGILEANALGTAVVNVGSRQAGRQRNGNAIIDVIGTAGPRAIRLAVAAAVNRSRADKIRPSVAFGRGDAGKRIADVLARIDLTRELTVKSFRRARDR